MEFDPTKQISNNTTAQQVAHPAVEQALRFANRDLNEYEIDPKNLTDIYPENEVTRDLKKVKEREEVFFVDETMRYARVLEAILYDQIDMNLWLGENTRAIKTSRFDDIFNGSDLLLELQETVEALSHLSLSVDVTFGTTTEEKKFQKIKENIDKGTLGTIKYFESERSPYRGKLEKVPQIIIGVEKDVVIKLAALWSDEYGRRKESNKELSVHPIQRLIFAEIFSELITFKRYAEETGKKELVPIFEKNISILENISREKGSIMLADMGSLNDDKVFAAIREGLKTIFAKPHLK